MNVRLIFSDIFRRLRNTKHRKRRNTGLFGEKETINKSEKNTSFLGQKLLLVAPSRLELLKLLIFKTLVNHAKLRLKLKECTICNQVGKTNSWAKRAVKCAEKTSPFTKHHRLKNLSHSQCETSSIRWRCRRHHCSSQYYILATLHACSPKKYM